MVEQDGIVYHGSERGHLECPRDMQHKTELFSVYGTDLRFLVCLECKEVRMNLDYFRTYLNELPKKGG